MDEREKEKIKRQSNATISFDVAITNKILKKVDQLCKLWISSDKIETDKVLRKVGELSKLWIKGRYSESGIKKRKEEKIESGKK